MGIPFVHTFHGLPPSGVGRLKSDRRQVLYQTAKVVFANTEAAKCQVQRLGCPAAKIRVIPQGIDLASFPFAPDPRDRAPLRLLSVGRLELDKGHSDTLLAIRRLVDQGVDCNLTIVGAGSHAMQLRALVNRIGIESSVEFIPSANSAEIQSLMQQAEILILASRRARRPGDWEETQGVVLQEALASGCLVVAAATGGIPESLPRTPGVKLVKDRSSRAIAAALQALVELPPADRIAAAVENRRWVETHYAASEIGRRVNGVLSEVIRSARSN